MSPFTVVPDKSQGDILTEANWDTHIRDNLNKGVMRPIADVDLAAAAASIDFTSIAADWSHLLLVVHARSDAAIVTANLNVRFNNDSGANYDEENLRADGTSVAALESLAGTSISAGQMPGGSATANVFGVTEIRIPNYANASYQKTLLGSSGLKWTTSSGGIRIREAHGQWRSVAAINRVTLLASSGLLAIGTRATLYGLGGIL